MIVHDEGGSGDGIMASARADVEALIQRHAAAIEQLSRALLAARWHEMEGGRGARECPWGCARHFIAWARPAGHGVAFERRGGVAALRVTAAFKRRTDGCYV